jgi:hypothetical protein
MACLLLNNKYNSKKQSNFLIYAKTLKIAMFRIHCKKEERTEQLAAATTGSNNRDAATYII